MSVNMNSMITKDSSPFKEPIPAGCIPIGGVDRIICDYDYYDTGDEDRSKGCGGTYYQRGYTTPDGWAFIDRTPCRCMMPIVQQKEQEKGFERTKYIKESVNRMAEQYFGTYDLIHDPVYSRMTLHNFNPRHPTQQTALDALIKFQIGKNSVCLYGDAGRGKTHLALGVAFEARQAGYNVLVLKSIDLLTRIKRTYEKKDDIAEINIMRVLKNIDLLVIDDIGVERSSEWVTSKFYEIIDYRHSRKSTIYTTNLTGKQMKEKEGVALVSRIWGSEMRFKIEGEDWRLYGNA